jgi:uncharacterized membrane protein
VLRDPASERKTPWLRILWIVLGLVAAITVISVLLLQTLGPGR